MSITWNGVSSDTIGVIVERIPNRYVPTRRFSPQQVAGRNGNILLVDKSFPNVEQEYEVYLSAESQGLPSVARACAEWLMGPDGYCRLQDSYDTTVYREAFLMGGYDLENILNKFGRCTITFSCKPQKYLLTGDTPIEIPAGITTYTGDVVQFDGVTGASITSLSTTISPIQDLHGYSSPWPAGGGKNKLPPNYSGGASLVTNHVTYTNTDGVVNVTGTPTGDAYYGLFRNIDGQRLSLPAGTYTISCQETTANCKVNFNVVGVVSSALNENQHSYTFTLSSDGEMFANILTNGNSAVNLTLHIQIESGSTATSWVPYENICPISGRTGVTVYVSPTQDQQDATTYAVDWTDEAGTVYGGTLDVTTGVLTVDRANIASYNGETITEPWLSSMDEYAPGATPTTGAQVVYTLATPLTYQLTAQEVAALVGENNVWTSSGPVSVTVEAPFSGIVTNPTPFEARPMLEVSGVGEITINGKSIQILESVSDFEIDCEAMEAEDNSKIYCMDFPELSGGENEIIGDSSITSLMVVPRWWTL